MTGENLHPAVLFVYFISVIAFTMCLFHPFYIAVSFMSSLLLMLLLDGRPALKGLGFECVLFAVISFINPLFNAAGSTVLFTYCGRPFTLEALLYGISAVGAFLSALHWFSCFHAVFTEDKFLALFSSGAPALTLLTAMVFRLVPELRRRIEYIKADRTHIGKGTDETGHSRMTAGFENLSALMGWSLENAEDTAASMNARGYGSGRRTCFCRFRFRMRDLFLLVIIAAADLCVIVFSIKGNLAVQFYPAVLLPAFSGVPLVTYILLCILPSIIHITELMKCRISILKI